ncbi:MAG: hypothetical protein HKN23_19705 [Verrucomicrobiales bacterium]|nr:hypothetical protein [Verrucomicrobiales bacterium]
MSLKFECPNCKEVIPTDPLDAGQPTDCPACKWTVMIPKVDVLVGNRDVMKFLCPACGRKLSADQSQFGTEMPCPYTDCEKPVLIPRPEWKPVPTSIIQNGESNPNDLIAEAEEKTRNPQVGEAEEEG